MANILSNFSKFGKFEVLALTAVVYAAMALTFAWQLLIWFYSAGADVFAYEFGRRVRADRLRQSSMFFCLWLMFVFLFPPAVAFFTEKIGWQEAALFAACAHAFLGTIYLRQMQRLP